jgi:hypothetical protein
MHSEIPASSATDLAALKKVFGKSPILATESEDAFDEIWARLIQCLGPRDFMEHSLIRQLAIYTWKVSRYDRHDTLAVERRVQEQRKLRARRLKMQAERRRAAEEAGKPITELDRMCYLEDVVDGAAGEIDEILNRPPEELEYSRAFEKGIEYHERVDELLDKLVRRRNDVLRQIEMYRAGLGKYLRQVSDEIIESERKGAEPQPQDEAPLAPSAEAMP